MILGPLAEGPIRHIAYNLREADRLELGAMMERFDSGQVARDAAACRFGFVASADDGTPVACMAVGQVWPGVYQAGMFATARWPEVASGVTRTTLRRLMPLVRQSGAHRVHCYSMASHYEAHRWLEKALGATRETTLRSWGRGGEDFVIYAWWRG